MINRYFSKDSLRQWVMMWLTALALVSCSTITEELPPCGNYIAFRYDYNMMFVDAFPTKVKRVDVYVFDDNGKYVTRFSDERESFGRRLLVCLVLCLSENTIWWYGQGCTTVRMSSRKRFCLLKN